MSKTTTDVNLLELRRLLFELKDFSPNTCIRLRLIGDMWQTYYLKILRLTENGVALLDEPSNKLVFVQDLQNVMQFEIDTAFQNYEPHTHYTVRL